MPFDPTPLMQRPRVVSEVIHLIQEQCTEQGWSIDSRQPLTNNPDRVHIAHIRNQQGDAIGMGSSAQSNAHAICEAFRSAWAAVYGNGGDGS